MARHPLGPLSPSPTSISSLPPSRPKKGAPSQAEPVEEKIQDLLEAEEKISPLSDEAISARLAQHGILCARRTVAKYRDQLAIPSARFRKK